MPLISVVMASYNREQYIGAAIESILAQTFSDFEFIIVDDGSRDASPAIIRDYARRDSRIRLVTLERNIGTGPAKRHGLESARGEFYAGMDDDDVCLPERLEKQLNYLRAHPEIGALGVCALMTDQDLQPFGAYDVPERHADIAYNIFMGDCVVGSSLMIRRHLLLAVGGYEQSRQRGNDIEMVSRLIERTRFANLPDRLYLYRQHAGQHPGARRKADWAAMLARFLLRLWGEAPPVSLERMERARRRDKFSWADYWLARRDLKRLIDSMAAANWIAPEERAPLIERTQRGLESKPPRLWQIFAHWRLHHFGGEDRRAGVH